MVSSIQKHLIQEWHEAQSLTLEWVDAFEKIIILLLIERC